MAGHVCDLLPELMHMSSTRRRLTAAAVLAAAGAGLALAWPGTDGDCPVVARRAELEREGNRLTAAVEAYERAHGGAAPGSLRAAGASARSAVAGCGRWDYDRFVAPYAGYGLRIGSYAFDGAVLYFHSGGPEGRGWHLDT
jgi:hypothetical protein